MRKSLLLLLTLTFVWFGARSNTFVAAINTADPIVNHAYQSSFSSLNISTVFGQFVRGMALVAGPKAPGCETDQVVIQLGKIDGCVADSVMWGNPSPTPGGNSGAIDTVFTNLTTNTILTTYDLSSLKIYNLPIGEYKIEYRYNVPTFSGTTGSCNVLISVKDNQKPTLDLSAVNSLTSGDTLYVETTDSTCSTSKFGNNSAQWVNPTQIKRPNVLDACDNSSLVSYIVKNSTGSIIATDDTLTSFEANLLGSLQDTLVFPLGFNYIIFTAYDTTGNTTIDTLVINVQDKSIPKFTNTIAISDTNVVLKSQGIDSLTTNVGSNSRTLSYLIPNATDNCSSVQYAFLIRKSILNGDTVVTGTGNNIGSSLPFGEYVLEYSAIDAAGNSDTLSHNLVIYDNEAPTTVCPNDEFAGPYYVGSTCDYIFTTQSAAGKDNVSNNVRNYWEILDLDSLPTVTGFTDNTFGNITTTFNEPGRYAVRQWTVDLNQATTSPIYSSDTCIAYFSVLDTIAPIVSNKPANKILNVTVGGCETSISLSTPTFVENCTIDSISYTLTNNINDSVLSSVSPLGTQTLQTIIDSTENVIYTYSAYFADASGNVSTHSYNIFVNDMVKPTVDTKIFAGASNDTIVYSTATVCDVTFAIDGNRLKDKIKDNTLCVPNTIDAPIASVKIGNTDIYNYATGDYDTLTVTLLNDTNEFLITATDLSGNSTTDTIIVFKKDTIRPLLKNGQPYSNLEVNTSTTSCDYLYSIPNLNDLLQVTDNCGIDSVFIEIDLDNSNNPGMDTTIGISNAKLNNPFTFSFSGSKLNDNSAFQIHLVNIRARDISGNDTNATFTIKVSEITKPKIFLVDSVVYYVNSNDCNSVTIDSSDARSAIFENGLGTVSDNCASDSVLYKNMTNDNPASALAGDSLFGNFPIGTTIVKFTTKDGNGNDFSRNLKIVVLDSIAPNAVIGTISANTSDSTCTAQIKVISPVSIGDDNCGVDSVEYSLDGITYIGLDSLNASFTTTFPKDTSIISWRSYDAAGNTTNFSTNVIVTDATKPTLELNNSDLKFYATATECARTITLPSAIVTENCGIDSVVSVLRTIKGTLDTTVRFVNSPVNVDFLDVNFNTLATYTLFTIAYDVNGNVSDTLKNFVTYSDTIKPTITSIDTIILVTDSALCTTTITLDSLGNAYGLNIGDNCGVNNILYNFKNTPGNFTDTSFSATPGTYDFEVNVFDNAINFNKKAFTIIVKSTFIDKIISAPSDTIFSDVFANECSKNVAFDSLVVNVCGNRYAIESSVASGSLFEIGNTTVSWYVIDNADTLFTYNFVVSVIDNQAPVIKQAPQDITLYVGSDCSIQYNYVLDVQDNCDAQGLTVVTTVPSGSALSVGSFTNTYTVEDESGNTVSGSNIITVLDTIAPKFAEFPVNIVTCDPIINYTVTSSDNCAASTTNLVSGLVSGSTFNLGVTTVTYSITDASGNNTIKSFTVEVLPQASVANAGPDENVCLSSNSFTLSGNILVAGETGTWSVNSSSAAIDDINNPTTTVSFTAGGNYTFTWTVDNGQCAPNSDVTLIVVSEVALADAGVDFTTDQTTATLDGISENGNVVWSTTSTSTIASPNNERTQVSGLSVGDNVFVLTVNNTICGNATDSVTVTINQPDFRDNIVAGFTPNGDGTNDTWTLPGIEIYPTATLEIYNRWGSIVFETSNPATESWDGTNEGEILPVASYYYVIELGDGTSAIKGTITIIK